MGGMRVKRIGLTVAYDGTEYCGWQIQENVPTVEGVLTQALRDLLQENVELVGASRTDSGVHALGNVAVFDTDTRIPPGKIALAVNRYLPEDIRVQRSGEVPVEFHPRHWERRKTYEDRIINSEMSIPTLHRYAHHVYGSVDVPAMQSAAQSLVGTHDFSAFCSAGSQVKTKVRKISGIDVEERPLRYGEGRSICIRVTGNGFLYNMVRIIAGTLLEIGQGRRSPELVREALESGQREKAGPTAPAKGLVLCSIRYVGWTEHKTE